MEARECLKVYNELVAYYEDTDVLVLGDLNSYGMEDAIKVFTDAGYINLLKKYSPAAWSYCYRGGGWLFGSFFKFSYADFTNSWCCSLGYQCQ